MKAEWRRVSRAELCPICGKGDWCGLSADSAKAICMRVESDRPSRNGGYIHRLKDDPPARLLPPPRIRPMTLNAAALAQAWRARTAHVDEVRLAMALGVSPAALRALGAAYASPYQAWAFPMRDGAGKVVGIRLRDDNGRKWAVRGSREGLFYPETTPADHTAWIVEGPTDAAAGLSIGLWACGRPSCAGGVDELKAMCRRLQVHRAVIISDRDEPKARPSGGQWRPGSAGALKLAAALPIPNRVIFPGAKDLRAWVRAGATLESIQLIEGQFPWSRR